MREVCSPINRMKKATPLPHPDKNKRNPAHAPVYGPPATGGGNAPRPTLTADVTVRTGGRNLSDPDPFPPDRAA
jgi:hypothetical protein